MVYNINKSCGRSLLEAKEYSDKAVSNLADFVSSSAFINTRNVRVGVLKSRFLKAGRAEGISD
jgi:hypothetical protein